MPFSLGRVFDVLLNLVLCADFAIDFSATNQLLKRYQGCGGIAPLNILDQNQQLSVHNLSYFTP